MKKFIAIFLLVKTRIRYPKAFFALFVCASLFFITFLVVQQEQQQQITSSHAATPSDLSRVHEGGTVQEFVENPKRGLRWKGLRKAKKGSICKDSLELVDKDEQVRGCTHGPDPAPEGVDVTKSVMPLKEKKHVASIAAALTSTNPSLQTAATVPCDGDGTSGYRVQALYVHASDVTDRYGQFAGSFQVYAQNIDKEFSESAAQTGGIRHVRFVTDGACNLQVADVVVPPAADDDFNSLVAALQSQGYNRGDRKYLLWTDANVYCGLGSFYYDDRADQSNYNNGVYPLYARVDNACWGGSAEAHEIMHTLGAVMTTAPHATANNHCTDEYDRMCYPDAPGVTMTIRCSSIADEEHFDCGKDDYFSTNTAAGSYLATHWNTANSKFLINGGVIPIPTNMPTPTNAPTPTRTPTLIPTLIPTLTIVPTLTLTPTVTPTPNPTNTLVSLDVMLHGIGQAGDSVNTQGGNTNPLHTQRPISLELFDEHNLQVRTVQGIVIYDPVSGSFKGKIDMGAGLASGIYIIKVKLQQSLKKLIPGFHVITAATVNNLPQITLVNGDMNNDNVINLIDYGIFVGCYSDFLPAANCTPEKKMQADLTDDGSVDQFDYNLFLRELTNLSGQ